MTAATTIAPALSPIRNAPLPHRPEVHPADPPVQPPAESAEAEVSAETAVVAPQHMQALARANEVRLARAELKRQVGDGRRDVIEVVRNCPWEAESMSLLELLQSQRRWGRARSKKLIVSAELSENKRLGALTERQRGVLAGALEAKAAC